MTSRDASLGLMTAAVLIWMAGLIGLATTTANPIVLNQRQVLDSRWVVEGTVNSSGELTIARSLVGDLPEKSLQLTDPIHWQGQLVIVPLIREFGNYRITPTAITGAPRLTYPSNEKLVAQVRELAAARRKK